MKWIDQAKSGNKKNLDFLQPFKSKIQKNELEIEEAIKSPIFKTPSFLYVKKTEDKGFGVFSDKEIQENQTIESCYCILLEWGLKYQGEPSIGRYAYWNHSCECQDCQKHGPKGFIALGYGSIYNSPNRREEANAGFKLDPTNKNITFFSIKKINPDEEILVWQGQGYYDRWCNKEK